MSDPQHILSKGLAIIEREIDLMQKRPENILLEQEEADRLANYVRTVAGCNREKREDYKAGGKDLSVMKTSELEDELLEAAKEIASARRRTTPTHKGAKT